MGEEREVWSHHGLLGDWSARPVTCRCGRQERGRRWGSCWHPHCAVDDAAVRESPALVALEHLRRDDGHRHHDELAVGVLGLPLRHDVAQQAIGGAVTVGDDGVNVQDLVVLVRLDERAQQALRREGRFDGRRDNCGTLAAALGRGRVRAPVVGVAARAGPRRRRFPAPLGGASPRPRPLPRPLRPPGDAPCACDCCCAAARPESASTRTCVMASVRAKRSEVQAASTTGMGAPRKGKVACWIRRHPLRSHDGVVDGDVGGPTWLRISQPSPKRDEGCSFCWRMVTLGSCMRCVGMRISCELFTVTESGCRFGWNVRHSTKPDASRPSCKAACRPTLRWVVLIS